MTSRPIAAIVFNFGQWDRLARKTGVSMNIRFNHLFMLSKFLNADKEFAQKHAWITEYTANALAADLNRFKPEIVLVGLSSNYNSSIKNVDLINYYSSYPAFADAWKAYQPLQEIDDIYCNKYTEAYERSCDLKIYGRKVEY